MADFDAEKHFMVVDMVDHDPVAAFLADQARGAAITDEMLQTGRQIGRAGFNLVFETGLAPHILNPESDNKYSVLGGAMLYKTSVGDGFVWLEGKFTMPRRIHGQPPRAYDELAPESSTLAIKASPTRAYAQGSPLFSITHDKGVVGPGEVHPKSPTGTQRDIDFCQSVVERMIAVYKPS